MRICILTRIMPAHGKGGMQDHILMLANKIAELGHRVVVITTQHPEGREYEFLDGVEIYYLKNTVPGSYFGGWWKSSTNKFFDLDRKEHFDVVHSQSISGYSLFTNKKFNSPAVLSFHGTDYDEIKTRMGLVSLKNPFESLKSILFIIRQFFYYIRFSLPCVNSGAAVIATSNEQVKIINKYYFVKMDRIYRVFNGIDINSFTRLDVKSEDNSILSVARIEREKGLQNIILALPIILNEIQNAKLVIIGDGGYLSDLEKLVKKLGLEDHIVFKGALPFKDLPYYFNYCGVFVNPTLRQNGYDLTILEAMACEKPVVVSNIGSVPTVIEDGKDGILVPPGDVKKLAEAVIRILKDRELAQRLGKAARKKVVEKFSVESMVEDTIKVYEEVIKRNKEK